MPLLSGAALVAHSGGPTSVINASLLGVVEEARKHTVITSLLGSRFGIEGILNSDFIDLLASDPAHMEQIGRTPASALGSSRREVVNADLTQLVDVIRRHEIRFLLYNGGNGSMGVANQIAAAARDSYYDLQVIGIPKTIDNDIVGTDHTPGYGSAARFSALAVRDIGADLRSLPGQVVIVEILGRNAGWIVAATALARHDPGDAPHLIYCPEVPLPLDRFLADVEQVFKRLGRCLVAVCEGQLDDKGEPFGADVRSGSRGTLAMNLGHRLALLVTQHLRIRARSEKPGLLARSNAASISDMDWQEARLCGRAAVQAALSGQGTTMITLCREPGVPYRSHTGLCPLQTAAFTERLFPAKWQNQAQNDIEPEFLDYVRPLSGSIAPFPRL